MQSKNILKYKKYVYFLLVFILFLRIIFRNDNIKIYDKSTTKLSGRIENITINKSKISFYLQNVLVNYYVNTNDDLQYIISTIKLGDYISITGSIEEINPNTNFYMFNYKEYLYHNNIYNVFLAEEINVIYKNKNIFYTIKNKIISRIKDITKSKEYLYSFIMGNTDYITDEELESYRTIGVSHLFAISGMHISFIILMLSKLLKKFKIFKVIFITLFILLYLFLINYSITALRACLMFIISRLKIFKHLEVVFLVFLLLMIYDCYVIYNLGFQISICVSFFLVLFNKFIDDKNSILKLFKLSLIAFLSSLPILIYNFSTVNFFSIFINILFVPLVTYILFPLCIITFIFPILDTLLFFLFLCFSNLTLFLNNFDLLTFSFARPYLCIIVLYYILLLIFYKYKKSIIVYIAILFIHYNINYFNSNFYIYFFDVGQGDSILIVLPHNRGDILIDTSGKEYYCESELGCNNYSLGSNLIIPTLKKLGIKKIDYLIITHGDFDHMGESKVLVNDFKIEKVIFNCGEFNDLENGLIKILENKNIKYYSCISELEIDKYKLKFLNTLLYSNENDNSSVIYFNYNNYKFLFMGDAGVDREKDILDKYNLLDIDILKVGHHGSRTSTSKKFIDKINPKYAIISVGKKNRYGHPNNEVLDILSDSKTYRTDKNGSIIFIIKNDKLKIETCIP